MQPLRVESRVVSANRFYVRVIFLFGVILINFCLLFAVNNPGSGEILATGLGFIVAIFLFMTIYRYLQPDDENRVIFPTVKIRPIKINSKSIEQKIRDDIRAKMADLKFLTVNNVEGHILEGNNEPHTKTTFAGENTIPKEAVFKIDPVKFEVGNWFRYEHQLYKILHKLGSGGMGSVFLAQNSETMEVMAIKEIKPSPLCREYWERECTIVEKQAESPIRAMQLEGFFINTQNGINYYYLILEYIAGKSLEHWIRTEFPENFTPTQLRVILEKIILPLCRHLNFAHNQGIIHRDITPHNIIITQNAEGPEPVLIDWGVAKMRSTTEIFTPPKSLQSQLDQNIFTTQISSVGNPPEVLAGLQPVAASDIYMMGAIMYYIFNHAKNPPKPLEMKEYTLSLPTEIIHQSPDLGSLISFMTAFEPYNRPHDFLIVENRILEIIHKLGT